MSDITFKKLPGVLSFQRGLIVSDGAFFSENKDRVRTPIHVVRHGIRGTQNVNKDTKSEVSNVQITETARTNADAVAFSVIVGLRFLPLESALFACAGDNVEEIRSAFFRFVERAKAGHGLDEVARRYARNILNGRWLWRNRTLGESIEVSFTIDNDVQSCNALDIPLNNFENYSMEERVLGKAIAESIRGDDHVIEISAVVSLGFQGSVEVFPSQNYVENKPKGFARPLYKLGHPERSNRGDNHPSEFSDTRIMGQAALRDQKIGNALRTIDTWYPAFPMNRKPIPVEPNGANLDSQVFFRSEGADKKFSAFDLMRRINHIDPNSDDGMFFIASLIRGGVFSEGEDKAEKEAKAEKKAKEAKFKEDENNAA